MWLKAQDGAGVPLPPWSQLPCPLGEGRQLFLRPGAFGHGAWQVPIRHCAHPEGFCVSGEPLRWQVHEKWVWIWVGCMEGEAFQCSFGKVGIWGP